MRSLILMSILVVGLGCGGIAPGDEADTTDAPVDALVDAEDSPLDLVEDASEAPEAADDASGLEDDSGADEAAEADTGVEAEDTTDVGVPDEDSINAEADVEADVEDVLDETSETDAEADGDVDVSSCPFGTVLVPAGQFVMGSDPDEGESDQRPEHQVTLHSYCIDATEATCESYLHCVDEGGCLPLTCPVAYSASDCSHTTGDHPATCITWDQASAYCAYEGKRLPTEAEWEKAARGGCELIIPASCGSEDERTYPWGEWAPTCVFCNFSTGCSGVMTAPVDTHLAGDSPYGLHDMAGNVAEWVADWYGATYYTTCASGCVDPTGPSLGTQRILRGGSWFAGGYFAVTVTYRWPSLSTSAVDTTGVRCAKDL